MYKGVPQFICPNCHKSFNIRSLKKGFKMKDVDKWIKKAQCPFCGKKISQGEGLEKEQE